VTHGHFRTGGNGLTATILSVSTSTIALNSPRSRAPAFALRRSRLRSSVKWAMSASNSRMRALAVGVMRSPNAPTSLPSNPHS
jgi:hypothetical protein